MKLPNIKITRSRALQILAGVIHVGNVALAINGFIPMQDAVYISGAVAIAQVLVNEIAHNSNPDGTPAAK